MEKTVIDEAKVRVELTGEGHSATGEVTGSGELIVEVEDLLTANLSFDYSSSDKMILGLDASKIISLRSGGNLTLTGNTQFDFGDHKWSAGTSIEFEFHKDQSVKIEVNSAKGELSGKATLALKFG